MLAARIKADFRWVNSDTELELLRRVYEFVPGG
jgi:hypothetical protein